MKMSISNFFRLLGNAAGTVIWLTIAVLSAPERIHGNHHPCPALPCTAARLAHLFTPEKTGGAPAIASVAPLAGGDRFSRADFIPGDNDKIRHPAPVQPGCGRAGRRLAGRAGPEADPLRTGRQAFLFHPAPLPGPGDHHAVRRPPAVPRHGNLPEHAPGRARTATAFRSKPADHGCLWLVYRLLRYVCMGLDSLEEAQPDFAEL